MLFNDAAGDAEAKAGPERVRGCDEWREEALSYIEGDPRAAISDEAGDAGASAGHTTAGADEELGVFGGIDGVDEEVGEDLADFALQAIEAQARLNVRAAGKAFEVELSGKKLDDAIQQSAEVDFAGAGGVAIEAERLLCDLGDAGELVVGAFEQPLDGRGHGGVRLADVDEVGDGFEWVIDLVRDGGGEAAGSGELLGLAERGFLGLAAGDVLHGADHAGELVGLVEGGEAASGDPALGFVGAFGAIFGAVETTAEYSFAEVGGRVGQIFRVDDATAELGAADGSVGFGEEQFGGALVEVERVGGHVPAPGAEGAGVESLTEAARGFGKGEFGAAMLGDILEEDGDALGGGKDAHGCPEIEGSVVIDELDGLTGHGLGVAGAEGVSGRAREDFGVAAADDWKIAADDGETGAVEIGEDPVAIHGRDAVHHGVEDLLEALGGLALELAGGVGNGDLGGQVLVQAGVFDGNGGLCGDGGDEGFAVCGEDIRLGMTVEHRAQDFAGTTHNGNGEMAADGEVSRRHAAEWLVVSVAAVLGDVGGAEDSSVHHGFGEDRRGSWHGKTGEGGGIYTGNFVELIRAAVLADAVVEEGTEGRAAELETGVEGGLHDEFKGLFAAEKEPGFDEQAEVLGGLRRRG